MIKNTLFFAFSLLLFCTSSGQFNKGYIVTLEADTVKGFLRNIPNEGYERAVEFKPRRRGVESVIFHPEDIQGFFVYPTLYFEALPSPIMQDSSTHYFTYRLFKGRLNIYELDLSGPTLYFVSKEGGKLIQLMDKNNAYMEVMAKLTADCTAYRLPRYFSLTGKNLVRIAQDYEAERKKGTH